MNFASGGSTEKLAFKTTKNVWDYTRVPRVHQVVQQLPLLLAVVAAFGLDTGGSIRQPSSFNGIVGMKPTYGRISRWGLIAFASSLDEIGPMTRTVKDNAILLFAVAGHDDHDLTTSTKEVPDFAAELNDQTSVKGKENRFYLRNS